MLGFRNNLVEDRIVIKKNKLVINPVNPIKMYEMMNIPFVNGSNNSVKNVSLMWSKCAWAAIDFNPVMFSEEKSVIPLLG